MKEKMKRSLAMIVALAMLVGVSPVVNAAGRDKETDDDGLTALEFTESDGSVDAKLHIDAPGVDDGGAQYSDTDMVRATVVLEDKSALDAGYPLSTIASDPGAMAYQDGLEKKQGELVDTIEDELLGGEKLDVVWNLTAAANLISINIQYGMLKQIARLDGVKLIVLETPTRPIATSYEKTDPKMFTSSDSIGTAPVWANGYTGAGSRIAIIDTGIDTDHQSFNGDALEYSLKLQAESKPEGWLEGLDLLDKDELNSILPSLHIYKALTDNGWDADELYINEKIPFAFNYGDSSLEVDHDHDTQGEHGSHVAGIAAANAYIPSGSGFTKALESVKTQGAAPDAQLITMKVFGRGGSAHESDYMAAIEDAFFLGADVVNLSLGTGNMGFSRSAYYDTLLDRMAKEGLVIAIAAGNEGSWADAEMNGNGALRIEDVSLNTVGSPASLVNSLAVASSDNTGTTTVYISVGEDRMYFSDNSKAWGMEDLLSLSGTHGYVMIDGIGTAEEFSALDGAAAGKIAVCRRGDTSFTEKYLNAMGAGAIGLIVINSDDSVLGMNLADHGEYTAPCVGVSHTDGEKLLAAAESAVSASGQTYYTGTLTIHSDVTVFEDMFAEAVSSFSAWGVPGSLTMKPEITAPGGNIYSVNGAVEGGSAYENMSGTSMASPQIAGLTAIMAQYIKENGLEAKTGLSVRQLVNSLLMSTAVPIRDEAGRYFPILQQGAGLANVFNATTSGSYIVMDEDAASGAADGKVKAELGEDAGKTGQYSFGFTIYSISDASTDYTLSADLFTQAIDYAEDGTPLLGKSTYPLAIDAAFVLSGEGFSEAVFERDVNGDGKTDRQDAQYILDFTAGKVSEIDLAVADLNADGIATTEDAHLLLAALESKHITLNGGASVHVDVTLTLKDREYLNSGYPNGAYIEGYVNVTADSTAEGLMLPGHSIPFLGFYGSWSDASMFDGPTFSEALYGAEGSYSGVNDLENAATINNTIYIRPLGEQEDSVWTCNPYLVEETLQLGRAALNGRDLIYGISFVLARNASEVLLFIKDGDGNIVDYNELGSQIPGVFPYTTEQGVAWVNPISGVQTLTTPAGLGFSEGDRFTVGVLAVPEYYEEDGVLTPERALELLENGSLGRGVELSRTFTIDNTAPAADSISMNADGSLVVTVSDNLAVAAVVLMNAGGTETLETCSVEQSGGKGSVTIEMSGYSDTACKILVGDYAGNETVYDVSLAGTDVPEKDYTGQMFGFTKTNRYGAFNSWLHIDPEAVYWTAGGYSLGIDAVMPDCVSITAAEYVDGYVYMAGLDGTMYVAEQGHWDQATALASFSGTVYAAVRDMAFSYSDKTLYALDMNNNIYTVDLYTGVLTKSFRVNLNTPGGTFENEKLVALAIDDNGTFYAVNTGKSGGGSMIGGGAATAKPELTFLYKWTKDDIVNELVDSLDPAFEENVGDFRSIDYTSSIYNPVDQSMAWDHDNDVLYWASSDDQGVNIKLAVFRDPTTSGKAEVADPEDPASGITLASIAGLYIVPETEAGVIEQAAEADSITLSETEVSIPVGATYTLTANVGPWNLADRSVTWTSDDESVVTVENGVITALQAGSAKVTARANAADTVLATCAVTVKEIPTIPFSALLNRPDGTSVWVDASTDSLGSWSELADSAFYFAGTNLDDVIYVHNGGQLFAVDADDFSVRPLTTIDITWNWTDAAPAPADYEHREAGKDHSFGGIVALIEGIDSGTSVAFLHPEAGTGEETATFSTFYYDRAAAIAFKEGGTDSEYHYYAACYYYVITENGELWLVELDEEQGEHLPVTEHLGSTGIDMRGVSAIYSGQSASMLYDQASGYLLLSVCLDAVNTTLYLIDPVSLTTIELGSFGTNAGALVSLYQHDRIDVPTVKVRPDKAEIFVGDTAQLTATAFSTPEGAAMTWSSDNEEVASVSPDGVVTGLSQGTAVITAACGEASASCTVTVRALAELPEGTTVKAHITRADGTGAWVTIDLGSLAVTQDAADNRNYSGAAVHNGKIYASDGIWITEIDPENGYKAQRGVAMSADGGILDGSTIVGDKIKLSYTDPETWETKYLELDVPGGFIYASPSGLVISTDDYSSEEAYRSSLYDESYGLCAMTWLGNRYSPAYGEDGYSSESYIQEWLLLGTDGYLWNILRRTYLHTYEDTLETEVIVSPTSGLSELAQLGIEFADLYSVSMTRVKTETMDGVLIADASPANEVTLYWLDLRYGTDFIRASDFAKLGTLKDVSDLTGLYTDLEMEGGFVDSYQIGHEAGAVAGEAAGYEWNIPEEYQEQYDEAYQAAYEEALENGRFEGYMEGYYNGYDEGYWENFEENWDEYEEWSLEGGLELSNVAAGHSASPAALDPETGSYFEGFEAGYLEGLLNAAAAMGYEAGNEESFWAGYEEGSEKGYEDGALDAQEGKEYDPDSHLYGDYALNDPESLPEEPAGEAGADMSMPARETTSAPASALPGTSVKSAVTAARAAAATASGGDVSLSGYVSGTSAFVGLELSASTNGLVTVKYDPSLLTFAGISEDSQDVLWSVVDHAGTVTVAYACADALTGTALTLSFYYGAGRPAEDTLFTLSASELGAERFDGESLRDELELHLLYIPVVQPAPDVTTADKTDEGEVTTETTATPGSTLVDGGYKASVSGSMGDVMVDQAQENNSDTVVVAPKMPDDADKTVVELPASAVSGIGEKTDADLCVETPAGSVTFPNAMLEELGRGDVTVSFEKNDDTVSVQVSVDGELLETLPGQVKVSVPLGDGEVAVLEEADGSVTLLPKSVVEGDTTYLVLDSSATVKIINNSRDFEDVQSEWFSSAVNFVAVHGLFYGTSDTEFSPNANMTRADLTTVLWRLESSVESDGGIDFTDVPGDVYYTDAIEWASANHIIEGTAPGVFAPDNHVTRQEMVTMVYRYVKSLGIEPDDTASLDGFKDADSVASWAKEAMEWAVSSGILQGDANGALAPEAAATRAEAAAILERLVKYIVM